MNLKTHISPPLWLAISNTYESGNYSHAILDAVHYLSDVLREKSGVDGDGQNLVGKALGGQAPILRVNRLQTESERNIQKGLEQLLRGLYLGIRNPRSHEQIEDSKETANAIILFINYLLSILAKSQEPFTIPGFLTRVVDPDFVQSNRYAELLVEEIPINKRLDTLIEIYRRKREASGLNLQLVVHTILQQLDEAQVTDFLDVVSEELKTTLEAADIKMTLQILLPELWPRVNEVARLRIENKLISSIKEGKADREGTAIMHAGRLGTWARDYLEYFKLKSNVARVILDKLDEDLWSQLYIFHFFIEKLPVVYETSYQKSLCIHKIVSAIKEDDDDTLKQLLLPYAWKYPEDWLQELKKELPDLVQDEDDIPF